MVADAASLGGRARYDTPGAGVIAVSDAALAWRARDAGGTDRLWARLLGQAASRDCCSSPPRRPRSAARRSPAAPCSATSPARAAASCWRSTSPPAPRRCCGPRRARSSPTRRPTGRGCSTCARPAASRSCASGRRARRPDRRPAAARARVARPARPRARARPPPPSPGLPRPAPAAAAARAAGVTVATLWSTALAADAAYVTRLRAISGRPRTADILRVPPLARSRVGASLVKDGRDSDMPRGTVLALLAVGAALAMPVAAGADAYKHTTAAGRAGDRRRRRDRRQRRHERGARRPAARRQRGRRRGRRRGGARRHRAVLVRHRRRRLHGHPHAARQGHDDRLARDGPARRCRPTRSSRTAPPLPFNDARYSGLSAGVPGTVARLGRGAATATARGASGACSRPAIDVARTGLRRRRDVRLADHAEHPVVRRHPVDGGALPRPRRHRARTPARCCATRTWPATYERIARHGARNGFYRGPIAEAIVAAAQRPPTSATRRQDLAARADDASTTSSATTSSGARRRASATAATTSTRWARRRPAARPSARR